MKPDEKDIKIITRRWRKRALKVHPEFKDKMKEDDQLHMYWDRYRGVTR